MNPIEIVTKFNESINNRDVDTLAAFITDDHAFIDSADQSFQGKEKVVETWKGFFGAFPDYKNHFDTLTETDELVVATGRSTSSFKDLDGPALWTAKIRAGKVSEWRVYEDTSENRKRLGV
jgi:ketosteroid isomerase-like protein